MQFDAPAASPPQEALQQPVHIDVHGVGLVDARVGGIGAQHAYQFAASGGVESMDLDTVSLGGGRLALEPVPLGGPGDPQQAPVRQQRMVDEPLRRVGQERAAGRGQRAHHGSARGLGVEGGGPAGGMGTGMGLPLHHHHGGLAGQVPGRRRARDPGTDHNHAHQVSLPRPGPSGPVSAANKSEVHSPSGPVSAANKSGGPIGAVSNPRCRLIAQTVYNPALRVGRKRRYRK